MNGIFLNIATMNYISRETPPLVGLYYMCIFTAWLCLFRNYIITARRLQDSLCVAMYNGFRPIHLSASQTQVGVLSKRLKI